MTSKFYGGTCFTAGWYGWRKRVEQRLVKQLWEKTDLAFVEIRANIRLDVNPFGRDAGKRQRSMLMRWTTSVTPMRSLGKQMRQVSGVIRNARGHPSPDPVAPSWRVPIGPTRWGMEPWQRRVQHGPRPRRRLALCVLSWGIRHPRRPYPPPARTYYRTGWLCGDASKKKLFSAHLKELTTWSLWGYPTLCS